MNKTIKKMLAFVLSFAMVLGSVTIGTAEEQAVKIVVGSITQTVWSGEEAIVPVTMENNKESIYGLRLQVTYDADVLEYEACDVTGGLLAGVQDVLDINQDNEGKVSIAFVEAETPITAENGLLCNIKFKAKEVESLTQTQVDVAVKDAVGIESDDKITKLDAVRNAEIVAGTVSVNQKNNYSLIVTGTNETAKQGETATVTFNVDETKLQDIKAAAIEITYDKDALSVADEKDVVPGEALSANGNSHSDVNIEKKPGEISVMTIIGDDDILTAAGTLLTVTFTADSDAEAATYPVSLEITSLKNSDRTDVIEDTAVVVNDGSVEITEEDSSGVTIQKTTATETEDAKTIIYAPTTLNKMTKVNAQIAEDIEDDCDVMELSAWADYGSDYGVCHVILTEDNASNLISVTANAKVSYEGTHFGLIVYTPDEDQEVQDANINRASQIWTSSTEWSEYTLLEEEQYGDIASIYWGLSSCKAGIWVKNVTTVYQKTDIDKALDNAIITAEGIRNPSSALTAALNAAKQYKISTTTDIETAVLATQAEIEEVTNILLAAIDQEGEEPVVQTALEKVNAAVDAVSLKSVMEANAAALGLDLEIYNSLTDAQRTAVMEEVLTNRPESGYVDETAVKAAFDAAVEEQSDGDDTPDEPIHDDHITQVTSAEEDDSIKTFVLAPSTLKKLANFGVFDEEKICDNGYDVLGLICTMPAGNDTKSATGVYLTTDNGENLISVNAYVKRYSGDGHYVLYIGDGDKGTRYGQTGTWGLSDAYWDDAWIPLTSSNNHSGQGDYVWIGVGLAGNQTVSMYLKNVSVVYRKSDIDKSLDEAIAAAMAIENPSSDLTAALNQAKQYKISTTTDIETAALATQAEIDTAAKTLAAEVAKASGITPPEPEKTALEKVNEATADSLQTIIEENAAELRLSLTAYHQLTAEKKEAVIAEVFAQRPENGYASNTAVKAVFDAAVEKQSEGSQPPVEEKTVLEKVNDASDVDTLKSVMEGNGIALGLDFMYYNWLEEDEKENVIEAVLTGRPESGYSSEAAIKAAFDAAVEEQLKEEEPDPEEPNPPVEEKTALEKVNEATADTLQTVIEENADALELDLTTYNKLNSDKKATVIAAVLAEKPESGYADSTALKAIFDAETAKAAANDGSNTGSSGGGFIGGGSASSGGNSSGGTSDNDSNTDDSSNTGDTINTPAADASARVYRNIAVGQKGKIKTSSAIGAAIQFKSSNKSIATVSDAGVVTALKSGKVNISVYVTKDGVTTKTTIRLTVKNKKKVPTAIRNLGEVKTTAEGTPVTIVTKSMKVKAKSTFKVAKTGNVKVTYSANNSKIVSVTSAGKITAKKAGTTNVIAKVTVNGQMQEYRVKVTVTK